MLAVVFFLLCTAFSPRVNRVLAVAVLVLMSTLFASAIGLLPNLYHVLHRLFCRQRLSGLPVLAGGFAGHRVPAGYSLVAFLPVIAAIVLRRRFNFAPTTWAVAGHPGRRRPDVLRRRCGCCACRRQRAGFATPYYQRPVPRQSVERLALITTMRLDVQRLLFGWNASIQPPPTMRLPGCRIPKKRISRWSITP